MSFCTCKKPKPKIQPVIPDLFYNMAPKWTVFVHLLHSLTFLNISTEISNPRRWIFSSHFPHSPESWHGTLSLIQLSLEIWCLKTQFKAAASAALPPAGAAPSLHIVEVFCPTSGFTLTSARLEHLEWWGSKWCQNTADFSPILIHPLVGPRASAPRRSSSHLLGRLLWVLETVLLSLCTYAYV